MAVTATKSDPHRRTLILQSPATLADDLGAVGEWVAPRTGPIRRTHGQLEDYVLRRLLVAQSKVGDLAFPVEIQATTQGTQRDSRLPDFVISNAECASAGLEVTQAGEENYQRWLTESSRGRRPDVPPEELSASTERTVEAFVSAIRKKVADFDKGKYDGVSPVDLAVYDNTSWGGFLDKRDIVARLGRPNDLLERFRAVHLVFGSHVFLDVFGRKKCVNIHDHYLIDYTAWLSDQVEKLRRADVASLDIADIAEELSDLGKNEHHAVESHLAVLMLHLLKWQFQPERRSHSWEASIRSARRKLYRLLTASPSLRAYARKTLEDAYADARDGAIVETLLPPETFPATCPYEYQQVLDSEFLPDARK